MSEYKPIEIKAKLLLVNTRTMTPIVWCEDYSMVLEYIATEPREVRGDFAVYQFKTRPQLRIHDGPDIPMVECKSEKRRSLHTGEEYYFLTPITKPAEFTEPITVCDSCGGCKPCGCEETIA